MDEKQVVYVWQNARGEVMGVYARGSVAALDANRFDPNQDNGHTITEWNVDTEPQVPKADPASSSQETDRV